MNRTYGVGYPHVRERAIGRSVGYCQFCAQRPATQGHRWVMCHAFEVVSNKAIS